MGSSKDLEAVLRRFLVDGTFSADLPPADERAFAALAREHRLASLLAAALPSGARWDALRGDLQAAARQSLFVVMQQLELAARVGGLLASRGIRCLPLKGAALAENTYDSPGDRPMADVDLLALDDPDAAMALLADHGFTEVARAEHAVAFRDPATRIPLELHRHVTSCAELFPIDTRGLWERSRHQAGLVGRVPSPEDLLVLLSLHAAFQHGLVLSLVQYLDFRRVLERLRPDPERVLELSAACGAEAALLTATAAAERVVAAPMPEAFRRRLAAQPPLARWVARRLEGPLLEPAVPPLARTRWALARGRRLRLLRLTLEPAGPPRSPWARMNAAARRGARLVRHVVTSEG